jgi:hypothetical protein
VDAGHESLSTPQAAPAAPQKSIAERLASVTDFLYRLLKKVEQLRACTEKVRHGLCFVHCLKSVDKFTSPVLFAESKP